MSDRAVWGSRLGFIMTTAGFAVGLGAIWRFPYMMSKNGGGAFLLVYLLTTLAVGVPLFIVEVMLGRVTRHGGVLGMQQLTPPRSPFRLVGWLGAAAGIGILSYYCVILALLLIYWLKSLGGAFAYGTDIGSFARIFDLASSSVASLGFAVLAAVLLMGVVIRAGLKPGLERTCKWLMPVLLLFLGILAVRSLSLPEAGKGEAWFLKPDFGRIDLQVTLDALGHTFFAVGIGVGVNSLLSKSLGERNQEAANRAAGNGIVLMAIATVLFVLFGLFGVRPYFAVQSTNPETVEGGIVYTRICCVFSLGCFASILGERLLQATGRTVHTMITQSTGAIINIILDPILIHGWFGLPAMGIAGAAVATVIGQWVSGIMVILFNLKFNPEVQLHKKYLPLEGKAVVPILTVGIPSIVMNGIGSVMNFGINQILQGFAETATGVFGVYFKLQSFFFMPLFGLNNATISIIAYNYGARKPHRITKTLKISCAAALCIMTVGLLVFQFFPDVLLGLFNPSQAFLEIGRVALRTISWSFPIAAVCIALGASFQALGDGIYSTIVSLCRQLVVLLPAAYLLSLTGQVQRVWLAFPIAEVVSGTVTFICFTRIYRQKIRPLFHVL